MVAEQITVPVALPIAGSDSGGGAGIQADMRTFAALKVYGTTALTLVTAQNTLGVSRVFALPPELVALQIDAVMRDFPVGAAKTGALGNAAVVAAVSGKVREYGIENLVVDPVMISKHGHRLIEEDAAKLMIEMLFPQALIVTPNVHEAAAILGMRAAAMERAPDNADLDSALGAGDPAHEMGESAHKLGDPAEAARKLCALGPKYALLKGGHMEGADAVDYLSDGSAVIEISAPRIATRHTHGTGCTLSAAVCAYLARGLDTHSAVLEAKKYIRAALASAAAVGQGISPVHHMHEYYKWRQAGGDD